MKKIISIISVCLIVGVIAFFGVMIFRTSNIKSVEIVGDIQTVYFVDSTNSANFNDANLKITYENGSVKMKKLTYDIVSVKNFSTSIANDGIMKITYKSITMDVGYSVIWKGLYYLSNKTEHVFNGSEITKTNYGPYVAGVTETNQDKTDTTEMIYFNDDGSCDYYLRTNSTDKWIMDDGYYNKKFYYNITGDTVNAYLGDDKVYQLKTKVTKDGALTLVSTEEKYVTSVNDSIFVKESIDREFNHYEMKGNRTLEKDDIKIYCDSEIVFAKDSAFKDSSLNLFLDVTYKNDDFLKNVYVRINESMFTVDKGFTSAEITPTTTFAIGFYDGVYFEMFYSIK